ncbi:MULTISPECIES: pRL2-23 [unclassified Streptomyces]|uniref:pRL2-23 n=1 Tax=unclassified Streptomyces TaxID=2593676 RepID=UPI000DAE2B0C|nr:MULTISPECIES: pRL2-23 [unclassified Streptomyces]PZT75127.1 pRL2-23 [Streptomyces sp. AC1-42T]PZT81890.1 pRL2-23 [Streptomyces sp. AC1-42W]
MEQTLIAVLGTLAGTLVAGFVQARIAHTARNATRGDDRRRDCVNAVIDLAVALSDHRRAMWKLGEARLTGTDDERVQALRDEAHRTRGAITAPSARVQLLAPTAQEAARIAVQATYAMRNPQDTESLEALRRRALEAHDALITAAGRHLSVVPTHAAGGQCRVR